MAVVQRLVHQRRFKIALVGLFATSLMLGLFIVPLEKNVEGASIKEPFDGVYWAVTTITSVGYGDLAPVTVWGRIIAMVLEIMGVMMFGMIIGMVTVSLYDERDKYYRRRVFERFDGIDAHLNTIEKHEGFVVKQNIEETQVG